MNDGGGDQEQPHRNRQDDKEIKAQSVADKIAELVHVFFIQTGEQRQHRLRDSDNKKPLRELDHPIRVVHNGNGPPLQKGTEHTADERVDLRQGKPCSIRQKKTQRLAQLRIFQIGDFRNQQNIHARSPVPLNQHMTASPDQNRNGKIPYRQMPPSCDKVKDVRKVTGRRRNGGDKKTPHTVERPHGKSPYRDQQEEGEHKAGQPYG